MMSQWTHVNGSIRVDHIKHLYGNINFDSIFKTCDYEDDEIGWAKCNVPCGNEGSLQVSIWENPDGHALAGYTINIFGDLRDYDDDDEIIDWFTKLVTKTFPIIRDAIISIDVEYKSYSVYCLDRDSEKPAIKELK